MAVCHSEVVVTVPASVTSWTCTPTRQLVLLSSKLQGKRFLNLTPVCDPGNQGMRWPACKVWHQIMRIILTNTIMRGHAPRRTISW